jgi:hypothetical protein
MTSSSSYSTFDLSNSDSNNGSTITIPSSDIVYLSSLLVAVVITVAIMAIIRICIRIINHKRSISNTDAIKNVHDDNSWCLSFGDGSDKTYIDDDGDNSPTTSVNYEQQAPQPLQVRSRYDPEDCFSDVCFDDDNEEDITFLEDDDDNSDNINIGIII